jgi:hypothetical protein
MWKNITDKDIQEAFLIRQLRKHLVKID